MNTITIVRNGLKLADQVTTLDNRSKGIIIGLRVLRADELIEEIRKLHLGKENVITSLANGLSRYMYQKEI